MGKTTSFSGRREKVGSYLRLAKEYAKIDKKVISRAEYLRKLKFGGLDGFPSLNPKVTTHNG
jgi:hypothetical protein